MEFSGKVIAVLPLTKGVSKANGKEWKKQEYVIESQDQYPRRMCFNLWSDKIDQFNIQLGEKLNVFFDIDSREYNGRWYNDIRAWKVERISDNDAASVPPMTDNVPPIPEAPMSSSLPPASEDDDLPF